MTLSNQASMFLKARFPLADAFLDTTLPLLFFINASLVNPPTVLSLKPRNTNDLAKRPFATLLRVDLLSFIAVANPCNHSKTIMALLWLH